MTLFNHFPETGYMPLADAQRYEAQNNFPMAARHYRLVLDDDGFLFGSSRLEQEQAINGLSRLFENTALSGADCYAIGMMYYSEDGVRRNPTAANTWFKKAKEKQHAPACRQLGVLCEYYFTIEVDRTESRGDFGALEVSYTYAPWYTAAADYYREAIEMGHAAAQADLDRLHQRSDIRGYDSYLIGRTYHDGKVSWRHYQQAKNWYEKANERWANSWIERDINSHNMEDCLRRLGKLYEVGDASLEQNYGMAVMYFQKALDLRKYSSAQQDLARLSTLDMPSMVSNGIGMMYYLGSAGVKLDRVKAQQWFDKASLKLTAEIIAMGEDPAQVRTIIDKVKVGDIAGVLTARNLNIRDADGCTALHWAVRTHNLALVMILLEKDIRWSVNNRFNQTALEVAQAMGEKEIAHYISEYSAQELSSILSWIIALFNPAQLVHKALYSTVMPAVTWISECTDTPALKTVAHYGIEVASFAAFPEGYLVNLVTSKAVETGLVYADVQNPFIKVGVRTATQLASAEFARGIRAARLRPRPSDENNTPQPTAATSEPREPAAIPRPEPTTEPAATSRPEPTTEPAATSRPEPATEPAATSRHEPVHDPNPIPIATPAVSAPSVQDQPLPQKTMVYYFSQPVDDPSWYGNALAWVSKKARHVGVVIDSPEYGLVKIEMTTDGSLNTALHVEPVPEFHRSHSNAFNKVWGYEVGETNRTYTEIIQSAESWINQHPNYVVTSDNCRCFATHLLQYQFSDGQGELTHNGPAINSHRFFNKSPCEEIEHRVRRNGFNTAQDIHSKYQPSQALQAFFYRAPPPDYGPAPPHELQQYLVNQRIAELNRQDRNAHLGLRHPNFQ